MLTEYYSKLTGNSHGLPFFQFQERGHLDFILLNDVLKGKVLGAMYHNMIAAEECNTTLANFWNSNIAHERVDGVAAVSLGAYHYQKNLNEYFKQVDQFKPYIDTLFNGANNFVESFINKLSLYFEEKNIQIRPARYNNRDASKFVMRSCNAASEFVISPHDDIAQCNTTQHKWFEIQKIISHEIVVVNMCLENNNAGALHIWDIQPDDHARKVLEIEDTGYPYPPQVIKRFDEMMVPIQVGDIYCFNGRNVHAVKSSIKSEKYRTTISFFMGYIDDHTIVYWS